MLRIPFLYSGEFTSRNGSRHRFGEKELAQIAQYDPSKWRAPLLIGHDLPPGETEATIHNRKELAFGIVDRVVRQGKYLVAELKKYSPELKTLFDQGRLPAASVKLFHPDDAANPYGKQLGFRHIAFVPEPGVSGLPEPQFGEFAYGDDSAFEFSIGDPRMDEIDLEQLQAREAALRAKEIEFAARVESTAKIAPLVTSGQLPAAMESAVVALRSRLVAQSEATGTLEFSRDGKTETQSPVAVLDALLQSLPRQIEFARDVAGEDNGPAPLRTADDYKKAALEFQATQAAKGIEIDLISAYNEILKGVA